MKRIEKKKKRRLEHSSRLAMKVRVVASKKLYNRKKKHKKKCYI